MSDSEKKTKKEVPWNKRLMPGVNKGGWREKDGEAERIKHLKHQH